MPYRVHVVDHPALWGWWLLPLLVFAVILAVAAYATVRLVDRGGGHRPASPPPYPPGPPAPDQAVAQARLRYASGQLSRDEYLRILADLGAAPPSPPPWPSAPNPPVGAGAPAGVGAPSAQGAGPASGPPAGGAAPREA